MWKDKLAMAKPLGNEDQKKAIYLYSQFIFFLTFAGFCLKLTMANEVLCCEQ